MNNGVHIKKGATRTGLKIAAVYFAAATAWILVSDWLAMLVANNSEQLLLIQSVKGIAFVALMTIAVGLTAMRFARAEAERVAAEMLTRVDPLTGLPNTRAFYDFLAGEIQAITRGDIDGCGILLLDFRDFARINTGFGRHVGDEVLRNVGQRLCALIGNQGTVARLEEDKFALLLEDVIDPQAAADFAARTIDDFSKDLHVEGHVLPLNLNVGYALAPEDGDHVAELLDAAELALRAAKDAGHNTALRFRGALLQLRREHFHLESELRQALSEQALSVQFQPQYDLASGEVVGAEALVRWHHAELGAISPQVFIPVAEQSGLIDRVGEFVLGRACRTLSEWREAGLPEIKLAINVAGHQLDDQRLGFFVRQAAAEWDVPLTALEIEVTESMAMRDPEHAVEVLGSLRDMGISVALDDFGTGYSSLSHLLRLPVDKLKIDRAFISELPHNAQQLSFVRTLVALGRELGVQVVAEGVETDAQREALTAAGCRLGQGFLLGRPMVATDFCQLFDKNHRRTAR